MLERIVKYIPPNLRANKICRRSYRAFMNYIEVPLKVYFFREYPLGLPYPLREWLYYKRYGHKLEKFKDIHKGQRCFIIGTGPSILQQDLTKLKDEITFVVNWFALHKQYDEINPTYYCVSDGNQLTLKNKRVQLHQLLDEKTKKATKFFSSFCRSSVKRRNLYAGHQVSYLRILREKIVFQTGSISLDITRAVYGAGTVIIDFCLPLAFYMGFSEVYLLGCDCTFNLDKTPDFSKAYFYPHELTGRPIPVGDNLETMRNWEFNTFNKIRISYSVAKEAFEKQGRKIYNAGIGGKLELFERVNYDELF